jgi:hypothetical protein
VATASGSKGRRSDHQLVDGLFLLSCSCPAFGFEQCPVRDGICVDVTLQGGFDIGVVEPVSMKESRMGELAEEQGPPPW